MPDPLVIQIRDDIVSTLAAVMTANGNPVTLNVQLDTPRGNIDDPAQVTCVVAMEDEAVVDEGSGTTQSGSMVDTPFKLEMTAYSSNDAENDSPNDPRTTLETAYGEVFRALREDRSRGGISGVYNTVIDKPVFFPKGDGGSMTCVAPVVVKRIHSLNDPDSYSA